MEVRAQMTVLSLEIREVHLLCAYACKRAELQLIDAGCLFKGRREMYFKAPNSTVPFHFSLTNKPSGFRNLQIDNFPYLSLMRSILCFFKTTVSGDLNTSLVS